MDPTQAPLDPGTVLADPLAQLERWVAEAAELEPDELVVGCLATVDADGRPDARMVVVRGVDPRGVRWFTDARSAKGRQLAAAPHAAVTIYWRRTDRQVRLRGPVQALPDDEADAYFATRPRDSQLGAWASHQSSPVADRAALEAEVARVAERFGDGPVPRPAHWVGQLLRPDEVELWQSRPGRLHDRVRYRRDPDAWRRERLQP